MLFYSYSMHLLKSPLPYWYLVDVSAVFFALVLLLQFFFCVLPVTLPVETRQKKAPRKGVQ